MYNLIVAYDAKSWQEPKGHHDFDRGRVAIEYTKNALRDAFKDDLTKLTELPCLFAYEKGNEAPAQLGWLTKVEQRQNTVRIYFELQPDFPAVPLDQIEKLNWELDLGQNELYRTHVAVKDVDLLAVLVEAKIIKVEQTKLGRAAAVPKSPAQTIMHISPEVFKVPDAGPDPKLVSVMMPFGKEFDPVYSTLQTACADAGLSCERVDNIWEEDAIIDDIFSLLYRSTYVICDFSGRNANVFYEAGIAHTLGRSVIPIVQNEEHVPFDLRHRRFQQYGNTKEGLVVLKDAVTRRLKTLMAIKDKK